MHAKAKNPTKCDGVPPRAILGRFCLGVCVSAKLAIHAAIQAISRTRRQR